MSDDPYQPLGSVNVSYIIVNQIKAHYLAAANLLQGRLDRPDARFWIFPKVLDACSECIENILDRLHRERGIVRREGEKNREFRTRVCREAGLGVGPRALAHLKALTEFWNDHKHSGDGEAWKRTVNLSTGRFTVDSFHLTTAFVAAYYRLVGKMEQPDWIRRAEIQEGAITLLPLGAAEIEKLMADLEIALQACAP